VYLWRNNPKSWFGYAAYFDASDEQQNSAIFFLEKIIDANAGKRTLIVAIPSPSDLHRIAAGERPDKQPWYRQLKKWQSENPYVRFLDLAEHSKSPYDQYFLQCDGHWSQAGNAFAAQLVAQEIRQWNLGD
jgi:hypothetical protein